MKVKQVLDLFEENPDQVWVLEDNEKIFGYVTFEIAAEKKLG